MAKLHDKWIVLPHGPLRALEPDLLTVVGQIPLPLGNFPRRMTVVGLPGERSLIFSPIPLDEPSMATIEALGAPVWLVVPSGAHRLDARPYKARYPDASIVTAPSAKAAVEEAVPVDVTSVDLGPQVELGPVPGIPAGELAMVVRHEGGATLVVNDIVGNVRHPQGPGAWLMSRLMGFGAHGPRVPRIVRRRFVGDATALARQFEQWAAIPGLRRIVPSHGEVIEDQPAAVLRQLATSLR